MASLFFTKLCLLQKIFLKSLRLNKVKKVSGNICVTVYKSLIYSTTVHIYKQFNTYVQFIKIIEGKYFELLDISRILSAL